MSFTHDPYSQLVTTTSEMAETVLKQQVAGEAPRMSYKILALGIRDGTCYLLRLGANSLKPISSGLLHEVIADLLQEVYTSTPTLVFVDATTACQLPSYVSERCHLVFTVWNPAVSFLAYPVPSQSQSLIIYHLYVIGVAQLMAGTHIPVPTF